MTTRNNNFNYRILFCITCKTLEINKNNSYGLFSQCLFIVSYLLSQQTVAICIVCIVSSHKGVKSC